MFLLFFIGNRCDLEAVYEHLLPRFPASLTTGPFGGVRGRDFLCVQCLDSTLLFYEQETPTFSLVLGNRLLPEPIVYISRNDVFVTSNSSWSLECYRQVVPPVYPFFPVTCQWTPAGVYRDNVAAMYQIAASSFGIVWVKRTNEKIYGTNITVLQQRDERKIPN